MKLSALGGLISVICLSILLIVAFAFAFHYWQQLQLPRVGPRKKDRMRKLMRIWIIIGIGIAVIGVSGTGVYLFAPAAILIQPSEKPSVFIKESQLVEPLADGKYPTVMFIVQNGVSESKGSFSNVSIKFTPFVPEKYLTYQNGPPAQRFRLAPHQGITVRWELKDLVLTQDQIDDLNAKPTLAELYIFARGEYSDETGTHPLNFCRRYDPTFPNHLVFCEDDLKIE